MAEAAADVAVVGGGLVGATLALALAQRGFAVALIEAREAVLDWDSDSHDLRVSAITRASQRLFENIAVWDDVVADRVTPYQQMHVWDRAGVGEIHFDAADLAEPDLGHIVENRVILRALWRRLREADVRLLVPARVASLNMADDDVTLVLNEARELHARLLVGADGAGSQVRALVGIATQGAPYGQSAVVASVHAELGNRATAWQHFMRDGPLALLPLQQALFSIVWTTTPDRAERLCDMPATEFDDLLTLASESRLGRLSLRGARAAFPLQLQHAERYVRPGVALVGDAAHVIHPLAGQGVNLGLLDAAALVDVLCSARDRDRSPGALSTLRVYERGRRGHNAATQTTMHLFNKLFGSDLALASLVRNLGLGAAGRLGPLRRLFERVALGYGLELPRLCQPPRPDARTTGRSTP